MNTGNMPTDGMLEQAADAMPVGPMVESAWGERNGPGAHADSSGGMPTADMAAGTERVMVEMRVPRGLGAARMLQTAAALSASGFQIDPSFQPVPVRSHPDRAQALAAQSEETVLVRGTIDPARRQDLEADPNVVKVWTDTAIAPFGDGLSAPVDTFNVQPLAGTAVCPIGTCDCSPGTAHGTVADVAAYLGVDQIWAAGRHGEGIVIGIVDGGIAALGRPVKPGETPRIGRVIGGWPADWGTTAAAWGDHGNMTSTDALGMAPQAQVYDLRISDGGSAISNAISAFQWAINQHRTNGTPQVLSNSWGIFQESWDPTYARDPNHPFTRKVVEALDEGILVLFAAGNCGATCPDGRCGPDTGPGRSIWGANGHSRVITVGAVNKDEQFVGYSSVGPAALDPQKPDFCSITHFRGYFASDSGTSAATPIAAGVVALLKQANASATQDQIKAALKGSAKDIGAPGFDQVSGAGILRAKAAFDLLVPRATWSDWEGLAGVCVEGVGSSSWARNRLDAFVVGTDRAMWHKWWDGSRWNGFESLGGQCYGVPGAVSWGPNRIDLFTLGTDRAMWHKWWDGARWNGWESLGGLCTDGVGVSSWAANRLDCFVVGTDRAMWHKWWDGVRWSGWESLGGRCYSAPAAVSWGPNRIDAFVIGEDRALYHKWWDGSRWNGFETLGGICTDGVGASSWAPNRLDVFVLGLDRALWHKWWDGARWNGFESLQGRSYSNPSAVSWSANRIDVFTIGTDRAMYHKWFGSLGAAVLEEAARSALEPSRTRVIELTPMSPPPPAVSPEQLSTPPLAATQEQVSPHTLNATSERGTATPSAIHH